MTVQNMTEQARISCGIPKKIAMINDIAGYGRCSTTVSLPIISVMGVQVCPVPTSVFSNHTGVESLVGTARSNSRSRHG